MTPEDRIAQLEQENAELRDALTQIALMSGSLLEVDVAKKTPSDEGLTGYEKIDTLMTMDGEERNLTSIEITVEIGSTTVWQTWTRADGHERCFEITPSPGSAETIVVELEAP